MDRNSPLRTVGFALLVALREGGVDRNATGVIVSVEPLSRPPRGGRGSQLVDLCALAGRNVSPSARGAWIATSEGR